MDTLIMVDMAMDIMERGRLNQDITMDTLMATDMAMDMDMDTMVKHATIYLFQNFSKLKWVPQNLVKRNTHL